MSNPAEDTGYNVALRYNKAAGGYEGVITWTSFSSKADFDKWFREKEPKDQDVVEEGISDKRAVALTRTTPKVAYIRSALEDSLDDSHDGVNLEIFGFKLANVGIRLGL